MKRLALACLILATVALVGVGIYLTRPLWSRPRIPGSANEISSGFQLLKQVKVAAGYYPNLIFANERFYILFHAQDHVVIKVYDQNFVATGEQYDLFNVRADFQAVSGDGYFYIVSPNHLRKYDSAWREVKSVALFDNFPPDVTSRWPHGVDDMLLYYDRGSVYLGIAYGNNPPGAGDKDKMQSKVKLDTPDNLYLQVYGQDLELEESVMLKDAGNAPGSALLRHGEKFVVVSGDRHWNDSSLIALDYDANWNLLDKRVISVESGANEEFPMGFLFDNGRYFVGYHRITGYLAQPIVGEPTRRTDVMLKAFNSEWNLLETANVTEDIPATNLTSTAGRPHLVLVGDKLYVAYDFEGEIVVKEYALP